MHNQGQGLYDMQKKFNYGIYGVGRIGKVHAALLLAQGHDIIAIGDDETKATAEAAKVLKPDSIRRFHSAEAMAQFAIPHLDAVVIASHTKDHARHALPFIQAKIPVYLEKPLTDSLEESFSFVEEVGQSEYLLQIGLQRRYDPALLYAKELLDKGLIGEVREIRCILRDQFPPPSTYRSRGLIIDMGIHVADEAIFFLDEFPKEVWASVHHTKAYESPIDEGGDTAFVTFITPSNVLGRLDVSRTHASGYNNETYIIGTAGSLHVGRFAGYPGPVHVELWKNNGTLHPQSKSFEMTQFSGNYPEFLPRFDIAYKNAHIHFRKAIENGEPFAVTQKQVLDAQVVVEAAHRSAQNKGTYYKTERFDDLQKYRTACKLNGLIDTI